MTYPFLFEWLEQIDSTNSEALRRAQQHRLKQPLVLATDQQTAGRGRRGRQWHSKQGHSLCMSYVAMLEHSNPNLALVPIMCGFAACRFFNGLGLSVKLKWPNDLLAQGKKLAGMLCESVKCADGILLVVGFGVNVRQVDVLDALDGAGAISLEQILPSEQHNELLDVSALAQALAPQLHQAVELALSEGIEPHLAQIQSLDAWRGLPIVVRDNNAPVCAGTALGIDASGCYLVQEANGNVLPLIAGDLSLRLFS
jgi:BirA family biotin operon repressor/biotin-[acetyl-CoA-carboxylase] ligase